MIVDPNVVPNKLKPEAELNLSDPKVIFEPTFERTPINRYILDAQEDIPEDIKKMAEERLNAKKNKDWATADAIRNELKSRGIVLEDSASGTTWKKMS